ncbi:hypothetical protein GUITHDRAFT_109412 [Guillardia theta CCMP2712]|uniref:Uncharacterized protein n=1 Tax=Guillardia theta (strain CCMP2712) TaxID=905079 RepID=L1J8G6_GUITC|nr:hypothetical protein GUITHDRAFT_109412 [Guillardia theta CCMP2712]EKX44637.1 hypothetical protein GUITHDRAFT_109412 [Guillardia theta CCMP2712]|eukprot:XP_005831617.1 hypothetical protein GUITHDRAFT_109412 [Guillardia theta CCMP2712]
MAETELDSSSFSRRITPWRSGPPGVHVTRSSELNVLDLENAQLVEKLKREEKMKDSALQACLLARQAKQAAEEEASRLASRLQDAERTRLKDTTAEARGLQEEILRLRAALHDAENSVVQVSEDLRKAQEAGKEIKNKFLDQFDELQQECTRILVESHGRERIDGLLVENEALRLAASKFADADSKLLAQLESAESRCMMLEAMQIVQEINNSIPSPRERKDVVKATLDSVKKAKGKATYLLPLLTSMEEVCKADASVQCDLSVETRQKEIDELRQMVKKAQAERDDATWEIERLVQDKKNISRSFETQIRELRRSLQQSANDHGGFIMSKGCLLMSCVRLEAENQDLRLSLADESKKNANVQLKKELKAAEKQLQGARAEIEQLKAKANKATSLNHKLLPHLIVLMAEEVKNGKPLDVLHKSDYLK